MQIARNGRPYRRLRLVRNRALLVVKRLPHVHPTSYIHLTSSVAPDLRTEEYVFIGNSCRIGPKTYIGRYSMLAPRVAIVGDDHIISNPGVPTQFSGRPIQTATHIGRDVWVGYGAILLRGVTVGDASIVAAGSVVTKNVPPNEIWAGVPARLIRKRFDHVNDEVWHYSRITGPVIHGPFCTPQTLPSADGAQP